MHIFDFVIMYLSNYIAGINERILSLRREQFLFSLWMKITEKGS